jgi:hypothetical protein
MIAWSAASMKHYDVGHVGRGYQRAEKQVCVPKTSSVLIW